MIKFYDELTKVNKIKIYSQLFMVKEEYEIPNAYYINSNGVLYNCFGDAEHKETNLMYTYKLIKDAFYDRKHISLTSDGLVSLENILDKEIDNYKRIINDKTVTKGDIFNYIHLDCCDFNDPLLIKLIIGVISSKIILLEKFIKLKNNTNDKKDDMSKIIIESKDDINDILVRYCGFHKIESQIDKTITTSSIDMNNFRNYLDRDYHISIVPEINVDNNYDELYRSIVVDKFLEKNPEYNNKILMKKRIF